MRLRPTLALLPLALAACAERATAPVTVPDALAPSAAIVVDHVASDQLSADFTVTPSGGYFQLGPHGIYFPANAICDPATSTYGVTEWDQPCEPLAAPIQIHAAIRSVNGAQQIFFSPALRFVPSRSRSGWVWLYMSDQVEWSSPALSGEARWGMQWTPSPEHQRRWSVSSKEQILWVPAPGLPGVDESLSDATLKSYTHVLTGFTYRRIKHFSGYSLMDGYAERADRLDGQEY